MNLRNANVDIGDYQTWIAYFESKRVEIIIYWTYEGELSARVVSESSLFEIGHDVTYSDGVLSHRIASSNEEYEQYINLIKILEL